MATTQAIPGFANDEDLAHMQLQDDQWLDSFNAENTPAVKEGWEDHPFWADGEKMADPESNASKLVTDLMEECTPQERADSMKVRLPHDAPL